MELTVAVTGKSDPGLVRSNNEDSHEIWFPNDPDELARRGVLLVVSDGMGGSQAGEVASRLTVETVVQAYRQRDGEQPLGDLRAAVEAANLAVYRQSRSSPRLTGMGATCTAVVVRDRDVWLAHVGDSRAYLVRRAHVRQLTQDHSLVAQLVKLHELTPRQARVDPRRNIVTRSIGIASEVEVDAEKSDVELEPDDTILVCSDGLHGVLSDEELAGWAGDPDGARATRELIGLANERGGPDNITVVLARVRPATARPADPVQTGEGSVA